GGEPARFDGEPLAQGTTVVGASRVRLRVTSAGTEATLFAGLWDVPPQGAGVLPHRLVAPVHLTGLRPGVPREVDVALPGVVRPLPQGHRVRVTVAGSDPTYAGPSGAPEVRVALAGALSVPVVDAAEATRGAAGTPAATGADGRAVPLVGVGAVALLTVVGALLVWRRRRPTRSGTVDA
ncbi:MAG TPA: CocE/NonD family hydrolase C-terminal non-catalytic domain-containing protein, partial [Actinomycetales bacterium]